MSNERVKVIAYSGYRGEETPRAIIFHGKRIEVIQILDMWIEEGLEERTIKRFFKVRGSDGFDYKIYYDEKIMEWSYVDEN